MDLQQTRPNAHWADDGNRVIEWPEITFVAGHARPRRRHRLRAGAVAALADGGRRDRRGRAHAAGPRRVHRCGHAVARVAPPAGSRARRPRRIIRSRRRSRRSAWRTAARPVCRRSCSARSATPTSACAGLWAQVPQYVSGSPSPPAVRALLRRLAEIGRLELDLRPLDARCDAYADPRRRRARDPARGAGGRRPHRP